MNWTRIVRTGWLLGVCAGYVLSVLAGGPNHVKGDGTFIKWKSKAPVKIQIDPGRLGLFTSPEAADLIRWAAAKWTSVDSAAISIEDNGLLEVDINVSNYESYLFQRRESSPIIFDDNGSITDDFFGAGSSASVLGFTFVFSDFETATEYSSGWVVMNGQKALTDSLTSVLAVSVIHELGHILGLDHSQGLIENFDEFWSHGQQVPLMFPIGFFSGPDDPIQDDRSWLSWMYPGPEFANSTGTIQGKVLRRTGAGLQGANVVALPAELNPDGSYSPSRRNVTSVVSDFLATGTGEYALPGLPPGDYFVLIDPIRSSFTGGSGVGPFDQRPTNFLRDYFDVNESATDDPDQKTVIQVVAGEVVSNIDFVANEVVGRLDLLGDDDEMLFEFPVGFSFPFYGAVYDEVVVNSDGNLTFAEGDGKVGEARNEARFLGGPPRVAPLFTDMDPTAGGEVRSEAGEGWVKFIWDQVPEFQEVGVAGPNIFSVTLFSTGNILFEYGQISITPDPSDVYVIDGLQAVLGISPGGRTEGSSQDLSERESGFEIGQDPVYEVFPGLTLDLNGQKVFFQGSTSELLFPFYKGDVERFTGFAFSNDGDQLASANAEAWGDDGFLLTVPTNPSPFVVNSQSQQAFLGRELFGVQDSAETDGWVRVLTDRPDLASFFQFGNGLVGPLNQMDGSVAFKESDKSNTLYFTRLYHGPAVFPTFSQFQDAITYLAVVNPNDVEVTATFRLYWETGNLREAEVVRTLGPFGRIYETVSEIFGLTPDQQVANGHVVVDVSGPGAVGFELIQLADTILGLNSSPDNSGTVLYSAQLGHGNDVFTSLKLVNTSESLVVVTITAFLGNSGEVDEIVKQATLGFRQSLQVNVQSLFGLPQLPTEPIVGSIKIESTEPGVIGDVVFGDPNTARYAAALPLQTVLFTKAVHSQVSNGISSKPSLNSFTGLALFNPNEQPVNVTVRVYDRDGILVGRAERTLNPRVRTSETVVEMVPESAGLERGYIVIEAEQPIVAQQLFGNFLLDYLSAVLPVVSD